MVASGEIAENLKVWSLGALSLGPLFSLIAACFLPGDAEVVGPVYLFAFFGLRAIMGVVFTAQVWRKERMETMTKIYWTLGLMIFFSIFVIPYFWYKFYWEPHRMDKLFNV